MAKPRFSDRLRTRRVRAAATSPGAIVLAGAGLAVGIVAGLPLLGVGLAAAAYAARVAVAVPRGDSLAEINAFELADPWRTFVWQAKKSQRQFADAVRALPDGPLHDRLDEIEGRIETAVDECWRIAQSGQSLTTARAQIDVARITQELSTIPPDTAPPAPLADTAAALQSQLDTARRMDQLIAASNDRLRLLDAQLGELVTRVLELSVRPQDDVLAALGRDVESIVGDMEALRVALDETDDVTAGHLARGAARTVPSAPPSPAATAALDATAAADGPTPADPPTPAEAPAPPAPPAGSPRTGADPGSGGTTGTTGTAGR